MATTSVYSLPYQALDDAPHGPLLGQELAEAVEAELARIDAALAARPYAWAAGQVSGSVTVAAGAGILLAEATFPASRFTAVPRVTATLANTVSGSAFLVPRCRFASTTTVEIWVYNTGASGSASPSGLQVDWHAVQMTSVSGSG